MLEQATILLGGVATLAMFSFVIRENAFYRIFEHIFIGISAGFGTIFTIKNFLWPQIIVPMLGLDAIIFPDGTVSQTYNPANLLYLIPMALGCLFYFIYFPQRAWLAKIAIGILLGASAGLAFKGFFAEMLPQIFSSFKPLLVFKDGVFDSAASFSNCVFVLTLATVMYYFFFSFRSSSGVARATISAGRYLMMICFGAFFGSTVMARMALLVERLQFLLGDWFAALRGVVGL